MTKKSIDQDVQEFKHERQQSTTEAISENEGKLVREALAKDASRYTEERDRANQILGRIQMANGFAKLATVAFISDLAHMKENKLYQGVTVLTADGKTASVATWEQFCVLAVGISRRTADDMIANHKAFGPEALEAMQRAGIGTGRLNTLRRQLPNEDKKLIIHEVEVNADDKDAIVSLVEEIVSKHTKEKETLQKRANDLEADLEASRRQVADKNEKIDELELLAHKRANLSVDERIKDFSSRLDASVINAKGNFVWLRSVMQEILDWDESPRDLEHACAQAIARLHIALDEIQTELMLPVVDLDIDDSWMTETE